MCVVYLCSINIFSNPHMLNDTTTEIPKNARTLCKMNKTRQFSNPFFDHDSILPINIKVSAVHEQGWRELQQFVNHRIARNILHFAKPLSVNTSNLQMTASLLFFTVYTASQLFENKVGHLGRSPTVYKSLFYTVFYIRFIQRSN